MGRSGWTVDARERGQLRTTGERLRRITGALDLDAAALLPHAGHLRPWSPDSPTMRST
jgi:hypothetical protein